jgi:para-nitrobenzyl esterase
MKTLITNRHTQLSFAVLSIAALCMAVLAAAAATSDPVVKITGGSAVGRLLPGGKSATFKGLPFAQAPIGDLRWREPQQPVKSWSGIRQAAEFGATCPQNAGGWNNNSAERSNEDCLYLNVWSPEWPSRSKKPVMVWIHGGANTGGSSLGAGGIEPPFDGASLAQHGVVVVTVNYRLNLFGFLGHPELTAESPNHASGGYGLLDQVAALRWVRDNIAQFGGDPANVTLFGQSAGGQNTSILVSSPLTKGLIHKAIAQSGTPMIGDKRLQTPQQTEQLGVILAKALHAPATGQIQFMRKLSSTQIVDALTEFRKGLSEAKLILDVGMDGYVVPQFSPAVYRSGGELPIPMIIGSNGMDSPGFRAGESTAQERQATVRTRIGTMYGPYPDLQERALKAYGAGEGMVPVASDSTRYGPIDLEYAVDHGFRCEAAVLSEWHSAIAPTYQYEFTAGNTAHPPLHSAELDFIFGYLRDQAAEPVLGKLSDQMQQYWTNFAKTGDPNGAGLPKWAKYDANKRGYMDLGNDGALPKADIRSNACPLYKEKLTRDVVAREAAAK